tara:strand:- start:1468 stop:2103 length:636 start_codon:yes stop_codon:yes gene_type:complete
MPYEVQMMGVDKLVPYEDNPRINSGAVQKVADSISNVGWRVPIIVDEEMIILAGHTRLKAAKVLSIKEVPVHISKGLTEEQKRAYRIMDNKSSEFAEWDNNLLAKEFAKLTDEEYDLNLSGFSLSEIDKLTKGALLEFDSPDLEILEHGWEIENVYIPETNVKQFMLLYDIAMIEELKTMIEALREVYKIESPSDIIFKAVKREYKKNTDL